MKETSGVSSKSQRSVSTLSNHAIATRSYVVLMKKRPSRAVCIYICTFMSLPLTFSERLPRLPLYHSAVADRSSLLLSRLAQPMAWLLIAAGAPQTSLPARP
jgi:hypothetical protein